MSQLQHRSLLIMDVAYARCKYVTNLFSKTFYMGTTLMRPDARQHVWAIYAWCRRTDDLVVSGSEHPMTCSFTSIGLSSRPAK